MNNPSVAKATAQIFEAKQQMPITVVKLTCGEDIRRVSRSAVTSWEELLDTIKSTFPVTDPVILRYEDDEKDKITVGSAQELAEVSTRSVV